MARTIQSTQQMRGRQIKQTNRKGAQSGKSLPKGKSKMMMGEMRPGKSKMSGP